MPIYAFHGAILGGITAGGYAREYIVTLCTVTNI